MTHSDFQWLKMTKLLAFPARPFSTRMSLDVTTYHWLSQRIGTILGIIWLERLCFNWTLKFWFVYEVITSMWFKAITSTCAISWALISFLLQKNTEKSWDFGIMHLWKSGLSIFKFHLYARPKPEAIDLAKGGPQLSIYWGSSPSTYSCSPFGVTGSCIW